MKKQTIKHIALNCTLMLLSTAIAYGIGEFVVRVWFPQPILPRYVTDAPYGVRKNMNNISIWHRSPDYRVNVRTNGHGVRSDRDIPYEKPAGSFRILGLGDSFALGYEIGLEDTYLYQLERQLHDRGATQVEVINLGVSGFGTAEELITLQEEGFKYNPDMVVLGYFVNDIENNVMSNLYALQGDTLRREADRYLPAIGIRNMLFSIPMYRYMADNSQLLNIFRNHISFMVQKALVKKNRKGARSAENETSFSSEETAKHMAYEANLTARLLDEIYMVCNRQNIPFVLLNIPNTNSTTGEMFTNIPLDRMKSKDNIIYLDAQDFIRPYLGKRPIQWDRWHGHWLPWVHHLAAERLADEVIKYIRHGQKGMKMLRSL